MAATSMAVRDAGGSLRDIAQEDNGGIRTPRSAPEVAGAAVGAANPMPVRNQGSTGTTYSANLPDVSTLGTLLATIPANPARAHVFAENQSAATLTLVGDAGAGTQIWHRVLTGVAAGAQGADWSSDVFLGRLRIYGASGAQVSAGEF